MTRNSGACRRSRYRFRDGFIRSLVAVAAGTAVALLNAGCASPGEPSARKPPVPNAISDLAASQHGNAVLLTFTVPQVSAEGKSLEHLPTVDIYRDFQRFSRAGEERPVAPRRSTLLTTIPSDLVPQFVARGQFRYMDHFGAADFMAHPDAIAVYSVRTSVLGKKLSAQSNVVAERVYPAPEPISDLRAKATSTAVVLVWTAPQRTPIGPLSSVASYRIYRREAQAEPKSSGESQGVQAPDSARLPGTVPSSSARQTPLVKIGESPSPGFSDTQIEFGNTYVYSVRSVTSYSGASVESGDSNFVTVTPRDVFPPAAPNGLIGIFAPAASGAAAHVDLSWSVSPETDLAGYHVYRSEQAGVLGALLNAKLLLTPAFRDMNIASGRRYFYSVTAVDRSGNESQPSAAVAVSVPDGAEPSHD